MKTVKSVDIYGKEFDIPVDELQWRPSVYGIVIKDDAILLSPQFEDNHYDLPGGGVNLGEHLEDAVIREVKEETGLDVKNPKSLKIISSIFTFSHDTGETRHCIMIYYVCDFVGGTISTEGFDESEKNYAKEAVWLPLDKLDSIELASSYDWRVIVKELIK